MRNSSGDPISSMNGMYFTTKDKDNGKWDKNCAIYFVDNAGGWWYRSCSSIHINNQYRNGYGLLLSGWKVLSFTEMRIRPMNCSYNIKCS